MKSLKTMKTLNHNTDTIVAAIESCYSETTKPSTANLISLYTFVGQAIAEQESTSFVADLAKAITTNLPTVKGFSPRNLRRMRDFFLTYSPSPELMAEVQTLGWTQNTIILEACETMEERSFYIALAKEGSLSKTALLAVIEADAFGKSQKEKMAEKVAEIKETLSQRGASVSDCSKSESKGTQVAVKTQVGRFVPKETRFRQGNSPPRWRFPWQTTFIWRHRSIDGRDDLSHLNARMRFINFSSEIRKIC